MAKVYDAILKDERYENKAIRDSAKGEHCQVNSFMCNHKPETVVWAHSNYPEHGKGTGLKAHDIFGCYSCSQCHMWLDCIHSIVCEAKQQKDHFIRAMHRSWLILVRKGVLK